MHIEISPRQSGKTTRMIHEIVENHKKKNCVSFVLTCNEELRERISGLIVDKIKKYDMGVECRDNNNSSMITQHTSDPGIFVFDTDSTKIFKLSYYSSFEKFVYFDEFDFFHKDVSFDNLDIDNSHCYTTPSKTRTISEIFDENTEDLFCKLLQKNSGYKKYPIPKNITNVVRWMNDETYYREILGEFIKKDNYRDFIENYYWQTEPLSYLLIDTAKSKKGIIEYHKEFQNMRNNWKQASSISINKKEFSDEKDNDYVKDEIKGDVLNELQ